MADLKVIKNWQFYFKKEDGLDNMHNAISAFADFWNKFDLELFVSNEKFVIGGKLDGEDFYSTEVTGVERIYHTFQGDVAHDELRVITESGEEYLFYSDEHTPEMYAAINDMLSFHELLTPTDLLILASC